MLPPLLFPQITLRAISEIKFDIIGITESKLKSNKNHLTNITLINYHVEQCPAYCPKDGTLLKIDEVVIYKEGNDLKILKNKMLESIFSESRL